MANKPGIGIFTEELRSHAGKVTGVGERLGNAHSAAQQVSMHPEAFGLIGQFLVPAVVAVETTALAALASAKQAAEVSSKNVEVAADQFDELERGARGAIEGTY